MRSRCAGRNSLCSGGRKKKERGTAGRGTSTLSIVNCPASRAARELRGGRGGRKRVFVETRFELINSSCREKKGGRKKEGGDQGSPQRYRRLAIPDSLNLSCHKKKEKGGERDIAASLGGKQRWSESGIGRRGKGGKEKKERGGKQRHISPRARNGIHQFDKTFFGRHPPSSDQEEKKGGKGNRSEGRGKDTTAIVESTTAAHLDTKGKRKRKAHRNGKFNSPRAEG